MSEFRSVQATGGCAREAVGEAAFCLALAEYAMKNATALADSMFAAFCSLGEASAHILNSAAEDLRQRIAVATTLATAPAPADMLTAQADYALHAFERYAASSQVFRTTVAAGARACKEPLLERLR